MDGQAGMAAVATDQVHHGPPSFDLRSIHREVDHLIDARIANVLHLFRGAGLERDIALAFDADRIRARGAGRDRGQEGVHAGAIAGASPLGGILALHK
jgi:hypothetical protein